jgi:hypothetical protein
MQQLRQLEKVQGDLTLHTAYITTSAAERSAAAAAAQGSPIYGLGQSRQLLQEQQLHSSSSSSGHIPFLCTSTSFQLWIMMESALVMLMTHWFRGRSQYSMQRMQHLQQQSKLALCYNSKSSTSADLLQAQTRTCVIPKVKRRSRQNSGPAVQMY